LLAESKLPPDARLSSISPLRPLSGDDILYKNSDRKNLQLLPHLLLHLNQLLMGAKSAASLLGLISHVEVLELTHDLLSLLLALRQSLQRFLD
jgi:hypothetical protein